VLSTSFLILPFTGQTSKKKYFGNESRLARRDSFF
jgi:hypothetical protein